MQGMFDTPTHGSSAKSIIVQSLAFSVVQLCSSKPLVSFWLLSRVGCMGRSRTPCVRISRAIRATWARAVLLLFFHPPLSPSPPHQQKPPPIQTPQLPHPCLLHKCSATHCDDRRGVQQKTLLQYTNAIYLFVRLEIALTLQCNVLQSAFNAAHHESRPDVYKCILSQPNTPKWPFLLAQAVYMCVNVYTQFEMYFCIHAFCCLALLCKCRLERGQPSFWCSSSDSKVPVGRTKKVPVDWTQKYLLNNTSLTCTALVVL